MVNVIKINVNINIVIVNLMMIYNYVYKQILMDYHILILIVHKNFVKILKMNHLILILLLIIRLH